MPRSSLVLCVMCVSKPFAHGVTFVRLVNVLHYFRTGVAETQSGRRFLV